MNTHGIIAELWGAKTDRREVKWMKKIYLESHEFLRHRLKTEGVSLKRVRNRALSVALKNPAVIHVSSQYVA